MKAAMEAWGSSDDKLFREGFAKEANDPEIIAATMQRPGIVLKRPVGSVGAFTTSAKFPRKIIDEQPAKARSKNLVKPVKMSSVKADKKARARARKAADAYKREKKRREQQKQEALHKKLQEKREAAEAKARLVFKKAETEHDQRMHTLQKEQAAINKKIKAEEMSWNKEKAKREAAIDKLND